MSAGVSDPQAHLQDPKHLRPIDACGLCGSADRTERFRQEPFAVVECEACGLVYVTPRLEATVLPDVYDTGYWESPDPSSRGYGDYVGDAELYLKTFRVRAGFISGFIDEPGRVLDVGCAAGFFLAVMAERGWQVEGVELSPAIAAHACERLGPSRIHVGRLEDADFAPGSFDLVTLWDVVEHVEDPVALLKRVSSLVRPGGAVLIETQNVGSRFARLLGSSWQHYKHLEHLYHFSPETVSRLLHDAGLEVVVNTSRYAGKHVSFAFFRERIGRIHPLLSKALAPFARLDSASAYVNPGDEMIVIARKPTA